MTKAYYSCFSELYLYDKVAMTLQYLSINYKLFIPNMKFSTSH